jgi:HEAT repeat protein
VPALIDVLKNENATVRTVAAEALWQINRHPAAVPALLEALKHQDNWVSGAAARALGRIGAEASIAAAAAIVLAS